MNTTHKSIDTLLRQQFFSDPSCNNDIVMHYAECIAIIEKAIVVVSDLKDGVESFTVDSRILLDWKV